MKDKDKGKEKTYLLFHLVGYNTKINELDLSDKVIIRLIDTTCESALERAKKIVEKKFWFLAEVVEYNGAK